MNYRLWLLVLMLSTGVFTVADEVKTAFVKNNEVFVRMGESQPRQITHDGIPKFLPVWSHDGSKIAFNRVTNPGRALSELVVVDETGRQVNDLLVRPAGKTPPEGLRYVESVEWLTNNTIAVGGTQNIDLTETVIFDLSSGAEIESIVDNRGGPVFSQDGAHFAYLTGMPHFSPETSWRPTLNIDNVPVFPKPGDHVIFISSPRWSTEGDELAIAARDYATQKIEILERRSPDTVRVMPLNSEITEGIDFFWSNGELYITSGRRTWKAQGDDLAEVPAQSALDPGQLARVEQHRQNAIVRELGGDSDSDSWCASCPLSALPRKATVNK